MVELKKDDIKTLIGLVSEEIDKVGEARHLPVVAELAWFIFN